MATVALDLTYAQSNDAETLTLTDAAGTYHVVDNPDGWGDSPELVTNIVATTDVTTASKYHLVLDIVVTDKNGTETTYSNIDCYAVAGPFTDASDLIFPLSWLMWLRLPLYAQTYPLCRHYHECGGHIHGS